MHPYTGIYYDSRKVQPGSIFVAISGTDSDGHNFIPAAINAGASLIIAERSMKVPEDVQLKIVSDSRLELASLSAEFYGNPQNKVDLIGVTGTNGKTTVTHLIQDLLPGTALLGTMGLKTSPKDDYQDMGNTTPQSTEIYKVLAELADDDYKYLAMEVSSHALEQKRVAGLKYKAAVVTNLTQDHLDYHLTMDNYFEAKAKLFKQVSDYVLLNADDEYYSRFKTKANDLKTISFAINAIADYQAQEINYGASGLSYKLLHHGQELGLVEMQLNGEFNVYNSLAAICLALEEGLEFKHLQKTLAQIPSVAGRFEIIRSQTSPMCIVDYAHSPDGLVNVLKGARQLVPANGKLICLFGCGGDRDITKRPKMGKIAYDMADFVYVSSDNPRSEEPDQIIADILTGIPDLTKVKVITDRADAIKEAVHNANSNDVVVVAGKGHEDYQILKNKTIHFDDREQVRKALAI